MLATINHFATQPFAQPYPELVLECSCLHYYHIVFTEIKFKKSSENKWHAKHKVHTHLERLFSCGNWAATLSPEIRLWSKVSTATRQELTGPTVCFPSDFRIFQSVNQFMLIPLACQWIVSAPYWQKPLLSKFKLIKHFGILSIAKKNRCFIIFFFSTLHILGQDTQRRVSNSV